MKKSQVLAALALAFALGVVAPVANTVVTTTGVSAFSADKSTATYDDTVRAIAFVEENATYKAYVQIQDAKKAYTAGKANGTIADFVYTDTTANVASKVVEAIEDADSIFGYNSTKVGSDVSAKTSFSEQTTVAINAAATSQFYNKLAAVIDLVDNAADNASNNAKLVDAVTALRTFTLANNIVSGDSWNNLHPEQATISSYKNSNPVSKMFTTNYTAAQTILNAVKSAEEALAKYNKGYELFMPLLINSGLLNQSGKNSIENDTNLTLAELEQIANENINRGDYWSALYNQVQTVKADRVSEESGDNYQLIRDLANAWKDATGNEQPVLTVMERMVKFVPNTNDGSNDENNAGNDQNKAPNTGALTNAEGSASTTVAMVAGIATALTAAGAGVVAYRNARRSTRK